MEYIVIKNRRVWLKLALYFHPRNWGWLWKSWGVNCGPFCAWWQFGSSAESLKKLPRNWNKW